MAEEDKKQAAKETKADNGDAAGINKASGWAKVQNEWAREKVELAQARADRFFSTDDELPLSSHLLLSLIVLFFVLFVVWANFAKLDEVTRGDGKVIPSTEIQIIQHQEGGIVEEFMFGEGDQVEAGDVLMRLSDVGATSDLGANRQRYLGLKAKAQRLQAEAEGFVTPEFSQDVLKSVPQSVTEELNSFRANQRNMLNQTQVLEEQLSQRQQEIRELNTRIGDLREVIRLSREEMEMIAPLVERGSAPRVELLQLERGIQERQTELNGLLTSLPRIKSSVEEAEARIEEVESNVKAQAQTELATTQIEMNSIQETLSALSDRQKRTEIRSPVDGTINDLKINTVGGVIQPGQEVIEIVPQDDQLLVEARIRPADIAFLYPGQPAVVKITAYDYSIYGGLKGELVDISADSITNEEGESFYRVRIRTPETKLKRSGEELPIIPGMVASVDILTGKKSVMEYILKPFIKTMDNAMNER